MAARSALTPHPKLKHTQRVQQPHTAVGADAADDGRDDDHHRF